MTASALMEQPGPGLEDELELTAHGRCVALMAMQLAEELGFERDAQRRIGLAGALHDVGKRHIDQRILSKTEPLNEADWAQIRRHPELGERILQRAGLEDIATWVRWHHERPDGGGYPDGLRGFQIPLEASILAVADAYDAMITTRCYGTQLSPEEAVSELQRCAGTQFDPVVVAAVVRCG
jgi:HD-GYP domain-containing protein (c-di-GMP phosphodiesterase class II)